MSLRECTSCMHVSDMACVYVCVRRTRPVCHVFTCAFPESVYAQYVCVWHGMRVCLCTLDMVSASCVYVCVSWECVCGVCVCLTWHVCVSVRVTWQVCPVFVCASTRHIPMRVYEIYVSVCHDMCVCLLWHVCVSGMTCVCLAWRVCVQHDMCACLCACDIPSVSSVHVCFY